MEGYEYPLSVQGNWVPNAAKVKNKLQIYFQSAKKSGGGDCKVEYDENNNTATVWFNSEEVRKRILQRKSHVITIDSKELNLSISLEKPGNSSTFAHVEKVPSKKSDAGQEVARADLNVEDRNKQPPQTKMIVLENVKENMQKEMLGLMLEQIGNLSEDMFSLELITEINKAVISFTNTEDASQFLKDCSSNRRFQQYGLSARPLEQTRSVKVENLPSEISEDFLELMFEREKEGGGPVETIKMIPEEQAAIITFMDPKVVETVQNKKWQIRKTSVNVYPYYGSFEMALYGKDRPKWKMPNPFTQGINYGLWSFLHKKEQIDIIKEHMKNNFCEADFETSIVKLSPLPDLLRKRGLTVKHINDWQNNATEMFQKVLSKYKTFEFHVSSSVWSQTERVIESAVKEDVSLEYDSAKGTLTIAGFTNDVDRLKSVVEGTVQNVTSKIERENNSVSMEMDLEAEVFCILQKEGIQQRAQDKFPELKFDYKPDAKKLVFVGLSNEILSTRNDILETRLQMKKKHVEVDPSLLSFLNAVNNVEMSSQIFTPHNINALYKIHQGVVEIISISEQTLIQAETELKKVLVTQCIDTEDKELLRKPEWLNLEEDLRKTYNTTKITIEIKHVGNGKITICGISNHVKRVYELMSDFINKNTQIEECVPVQLSVLLKFIQDIKSEFWKKGTSGKNVEVAFEFSGPQIKLSGGRLYVQEMKASLLQLTSSLYTDCLRISKPGAREFYLEKEKMISGILMKDCNCMVMLQEKNVAMQEAEDHIVCTSNTESLSNIQDVEPLKTISHDHPEKQKTRDGLEINTKEGLSIILKKGYIQEAISTVIISSISKDLDLSDGGLSKAILQAAGPELQDFVQKQRVNTPAEDGDVVVTDGCQLKCDTVFHTVCPQWDNGTGQSEKILREIVQKCFKLAEKQEAQSISFPAIGTGNLDFPKDLVAKMMLEETLKYSKSCPIHLQEVFFIVHPSDTETVEAFSKFFNSQGQKDGHDAEQPIHDSGFFGQISTPDKGVYRMQISHLTLEVSSGDITKQDTDVIVNSSSPDFTLKTGVSKAILEGAGKAVESQCKDLGSKPNEGIIMTSPGNLPCKNIIHVYIKNNTADIMDKILSVLLMCEEKKFKSVSFPALGTGKGGISASAVADVLMDAVVEFEMKRKRHHLQTMKVIVFQTEMIAEFHESMQAREGTALPNAGKQKSWFTSAFDKLTGLFKTPSENEPKARKPDLLTSRPIERNISPTTFQFCAESLQDVTKAKEFLEDLILKEQMQKTIKDRCISQLTLENIRRIKELEEKHRVLIIMHESAPDPYIQLEGLTRDVMSVDGEIRDMIKEIERAESLLREAKIQSSLVQWTYKSEDDHFEAFDALTNLHLEKAFQNKNSHLDLRINNKDYKVNFQTFKAETWGATFDVKRTELKGVNIPSHWDPMNNSETKQIELKTDSNEFQEVKDLFRATSSDFTVKKIERIQNSSLWQNYQIKKRQTDEKNSHSNNERRLFHGTSVDTIQKINAHGFNRSFHGKNADVYGNGTYFAVDAKYSAQGTYSSMDDKGQKYMYLARVIVGNYTRGQKGLREPPPKDPTNPTDLYDSVVDKKDNPSMFVVFHDVQAYPEYLITFCQS
ncbi:protein mono-ADP-ribosyltransferase PARP14-like [Scleropages formosus]|uniref:protein mono-ADP-ribosyltransferase PARP14-like n=1 Tax=Scleropages formosus TaxID=113540 RepID=UPI0010FA8AD2|nr:protein mono-ADP-ribosyltransferase PARP14-like [Scleropages formosus]